MPPTRFLSAFSFLLISVRMLAAGAPVDVLIVAGQSNVLNWHASARLLPADPIDREIPFMHTSGAPPGHRLGILENANSGGDWTTLGPQHQEPFVKFEREFFGPEVALARRLAHAGDSRPAVIKAGYFGTDLARDWNPAATSGNRLYQRLISHIRRAVALLNERGHETRFAGFFWMQGEKDAAAEADAHAYEANLKSFIERVRADLSTPDLPFVLGRIGPPPPKGYAYQATVREAQTAVASEMDATAWVDTDDLPRDTDGIHLLAPGVIELGERWAAAWQRLRRLPEDSSDSRSLSGGQE